MTRTRTRTEAEQEAFRTEITALIAQANRELEDPESQILARLQSTDPTIGPRVRGYSLRNQVLLVQQATERGLSLADVATFPQWRARGRTVRKGEKALRVVGFKGSDDPTEGGEQRNHFRMLALFSIDQTEVAHAGSQPSPSADLETLAGDLIAETDADLTPAQRVRAGLFAKIRAAGFELAEDPAQITPVRADHANRTITVRPGDPDADTLRALLAVVTALDSTTPVRD